MKLKLILLDILGYLTLYLGDTLMIPFEIPLVRACNSIQARLYSTHLQMNMILQKKW